MNKEILKKLTKYTAASAAAIAGASSANATIVYNDINPNAVIDTSAASTFFLDLDQDGTDDFIFVRQAWGGGANGWGVRAIGFISSYSYGAANNVVAGSSNYTPSLFGTSQSIGSSIGFTADGGSNDQFIASSYSSTIYGAGTSTNSYLGVQFEISGQIHYGWIRFNSTVNTANRYVSVTLLDYAYDDCPGVAIPVGATIGGTACTPIEDVALVDNHEYTQMPFKQANGMDLSVVIDNPGTADVTDAVVTTEVYLAPNFTTPVQTIVSGNNSVTAGNSLTINNGVFTPTTNGSYGILHYVNSTTFGTDNDPTNDTIAYLMDVGSTFARDNDNNIGASLGIGAGAAANGILGNNYTLRVDGNVDSVDVYIVNGGAGNTMVGQPLSLDIYSTTAGTPNAVLHTTGATTVTQTGPHWETLAISGGPVNLTAGEYFFGVNEPDSNLTLGYTSSIYTPGATWINWNTIPTGDWANSEDFGFEVAYMIRPHFSTCTPVSFTAPAIITCDSSVINGNTYYSSQTVIDTLIGANACGGDSIVTTSLTINNAVNTTEDLSACTSATINGNIYNSSQVVVDVFSAGAANGCDSTHTTNLTINNPVTRNRSITSCGNITFNGNTYSSSQIVTDVFPAGAANGCDSTLITDLTVSTFAQATYDFEGCSSVIAFGNTYTSSQIIRDTIIGGSSAGCDSITIQNITVNMPVTSTSDLSACGSAIINGNTYTTSQAVVDVFTGGAANGCDSTHTTNLTINNSVTSNETLTSCGEVIINGTTYTTSQIVTDVFVNGASTGCDSTHITDLTINGPSFKSQNIQACDEYVINGNTYTTGGQKIDTIVGGAANGCDSIVSTTLDLGYTTTSSIDTTLDEGSTITIDGVEYDVSGTYTETIVKVDGCDSVITYNVTIIGSNSVDENQLTFTSVYPNPTNGLVSINSLKEAINSIKVMDIQGKELAFYNNLNAKMNDIDMASFENGVYFVKIELANGTTEVAKIVKTDK